MKALKRSLAPIARGRIALRQLVEADLPMTRHWRNQEHIRRWFLHSAMISPEQHLAWYAAYRERDDDLVFIIEDGPGGRPVGQVAIYNIDWATGAAEFGRLMIGEADAAGRGLARAATEAVLAEAFGPLALRRLHLEVLADNHAAIHIYRRCGFVDDGGTEGVRRMAIDSNRYASMSESES